MHDSEDANQVGVKVLNCEPRQPARTVDEARQAHASSSLAPNITAASVGHAWSPAGWAARGRQSRSARDFRSASDPDCGAWVSSPR